MVGTSAQRSKQSTPAITAPVSVLVSRPCHATRSWSLGLVAASCPHGDQLMILCEHQRINPHFVVTIAARTSTTPARSASAGSATPSMMIEIEIWHSQARHTQSHSCIARGIRIYVCLCSHELFILEVSERKARLFYAGTAGPGLSSAGPRRGSTSRVPSSMVCCWVYSGRSPMSTAPCLVVEYYLGTF